MGAPPSSLGFFHFSVQPSLFMSVTSIGPSGFPGLAVKNEPALKNPRTLFSFYRQGKETGIVLTQDVDFDFGSVASVFVHSRYFVCTRVFAFRSVVKEFTVVWNVFYSPMTRFGNAFAVQSPGDVWRRFAYNFYVEVERLSFVDGYVSEIATVDFRSDCKKPNASRTVRSQK